jgi:hypothetical protein
MRTSSTCQKSSWQARNSFGSSWQRWAENRAGRLEVAPDTASAGEHHARVLAAAGQSLSCVFLHLRDCPAATSRIRVPTTADVGDGDGAADTSE